MTFYIDLTCPRCAAVCRDAEVYFDPGEDAPPTSNRASAAFSDPGSGSDVGTGAVCGCGYEFASPEYDGELMRLAVEAWRDAVEEGEERRALDYEDNRR